MPVSITWHGHATLSLNIDGSHVVVDPFFTDNPAAKISVDNVAADAILITHGHYDHVTDVVALAQRTGAKVIANLEVASWLNRQGYGNTHAQQMGGGYNHEFGRVKMTPAFHGSMLPDGSYGGMPAGFLITASGKNIYISGDTALYSDMSLIGDEGLDVAILCIGDNFTMGPDDALRAVKFLRPKVVIPYHYNTWPPIAVDVQAWAERVAAETDARPVILGIEETYQVE